MASVVGPGRERSAQSLVAGPAEADAGEFAGAARHRHHACLHRQDRIALEATPVITEDERETRVSPDMQERACRELPELRGAQIEVFSDLDYSGKDTKRPRFQAMIQKVDSGEISLVAAYELSRITRDVGDHAEFFKRLAARGVNFISARERVDLSTPEGEFGAVILGGSNQLQRKQTARRVKDALAHKVARGDVVGRVPPGYFRQREMLPSGLVAVTIVVDPVPAELVRLVFREYATGAHSYLSLARWLNQQGYACPRSLDLRESRAGST